MEAKNIAGSENGTRRVIFESGHKKANTEKDEKRLEDYPIVKCAPGEKVLLVQRRHIVSLLDSIVLEGIITMVVLLAIFSPIIFNVFLFFDFYNLTFALYIGLAVLSIFFTRSIYTFLHWYYQLYVITNRAIIHRSFFRIVGEYSETVYGDKMHVQDVTRKATNTIYDYFKIQDVYVYFHKLERERPFIFKTPENAQKVDDLIQSLVTQSNGEKKIL
ncbi:MAG: hypothetical protein WD967_01485 [Candidatus Levyibacteriota bacterium]